MAKQNKIFAESLFDNMLTYQQYLQILSEMAMSTFVWNNLPDSVDERTIELNLLRAGMCVYFNDDVLGNLCLPVLPSSSFDVYGNPYKRTAYSNYNSYHMELSVENSVIIYNNKYRSPSYQYLVNTAKRLYNCDRIQDVNINAQKTPYFILASEAQRLTMQNIFEKIDGNQPVIFGDKHLEMANIKVLDLKAPFVADKINDMKVRIWNEALTVLGIPNVSISKKERLVSDEVSRNQGGIMVNRNSRLIPRLEACKKINNMFGTRISVSFNDEYNDSKEGDIIE